MCLTAAECVKDLMAKGGWDISMIVTWQHDARKLAYLSFSLGKKCKKKDIDLFSSFIYSFETWAYREEWPVFDRL